MRPIDAERLKEGLEYHYHPTDQEYEEDRQWAVGYNAGLDRALYSLAYAPTITLDDLRPHGRWLNVRILSTGDGRMRAGNCSCCGSTEKLRNFCPNCGAKMDLKGDGSDA